METLNISDARKNLSSIVQALSENKRDAVKIDVRGKATAVIISNEEYERMQQQILDREIDLIFTEFHDVNEALTSKWHVRSIT